MHYGCRTTHPSTGNTYEAGTARWDRVETELATISTAGASRHRAPTVMPSHRPVTSHPWNSAPFAPHAILFAFPQGNIVRSVDLYTSIQLKRSGPPAAPKPSFSCRPADAHVLTVSRPHPPRVIGAAGSATHSDLLSAPSFGVLLLSPLPSLVPRSGCVHRFCMFDGGNHNFRS